MAFSKMIYLSRFQPDRLLPQGLCKCRFHRLELLFHPLCLFLLLRRNCHPASLASRSSTGKHLFLFVFVFLFTVTKTVSSNVFGCTVLFTCASISTVLGTARVNEAARMELGL